ncbi:DMT family transporter [Erythrobacter sp. LQ02-29]|uniref:DMT family transporter n=1 Tax=Erythrobacter sp. LQ02-29 TaxID=2920384 RepID=UPI001F4F0587|nr:DMT family transporter [Erythrobacter sp. LQ02-29]MCP9222342.1 DMT family transporter [Erythrobacter sp. LQ02-29]
MQTDDRAGLAFALAGFACLSFGDAIIKTMAGQWSPLAVAALRYAFGAVGLSALLLVHEGPRAFRPAKPWLQAARGLFVALATLCFFSAVFVMPLAEATAIVFVSPIITALLSRPLLGERVYPSTVIASVIAFAGVLIVLRPNVAAIGVAAFLPLGSAIFMSLLVIANRASSGQGSALSMQSFVAGFAAPVLIAAAVLGQASGFEPLRFGWPEWDVIARCAIVAFTASTAHWLIYLATMRAGAATIAPMTYVQLLVASALGWWWFGDRPDIVTYAGALVIIMAGLYLWYAGRQRQRAARRAMAIDS